MQAKFQSNRALKSKLLKTQKQLWKKSNLERVKVGAISSKQKDTVLLKPFGRIIQSLHIQESCNFVKMLQEFPNLQETCKILQEIGVQFTRKDVATLYMFKTVSSDHQQGIFSDISR